MLGACQKTFGQFYASLNRRITKEVYLPKINLRAYFEKVLVGEDYLNCCEKSCSNQRITFSASLSLKENVKS